TTQRLWRTTTRAVYAPFTCHNWPTISYSGASTDSSLCVPLTSGRTQLCDRFSLTTGFASRRVEAPPSDGPPDLESARPGTGRSVRLTGIHSLPVVVRPDRGPHRYRCTGTQLAEGLTQVCFSPSEPHCTDTVQSQGG
ncbi:hypothetical protein M9458_052473, partial [Cirrhinus mrigala]